ncbi:MAG: S41 family peptidase [Lachnospiraceae bacterium]|nr:S41 family peptidase [Lachnospiraceae bacterium]
MFKKIFALAVIGSLCLSLVGCESVLDRSKASSGESAKEGNSSFSMYDDEVEEKVDEINDYIDAYFYFETDEEAQEEAIYDGIMAGLDDPYSVYYTQEEFADLMEENSGEYVGVGAVVTQGTDKAVTIVRPIPGSPAEEVGLMAEDIVVQVGDVEITNQDLSTVVDMIRGEEGTQVYIKVYRPSENDYVEFEVTRRVVENVTVYAEMLDDNIGYIQVQQFYENTDEEFIDAIKGMQSKNVKGIIVDLRDNPGGLLDSVVNMCDFIMDEGPILTTKDKHGNVIQKYDSSAKESLDIPMVVLVNGNSASASEIFAGAMKDTGKAELVGTTTFGKGIVQSVLPLSDGTAIKLTVAKYFTPAGTDIHEAGVEPDYVIELPDGKESAVNVKREEDTQLDKAIDIIFQIQ